MIQRISIQPYQIENYTEVKINSPGIMNGFPLVSIDTSSYIVGAEIQSGINFDLDAGRHCIAIGKGCSLADAITFIIDINHDYASVVQGELSFLRNVRTAYKSRRKATIIIQNDVWIGHGATIMAGVTLHSGCVVAANAVVTKDVPAYAIVGGNPARIIRYRFDEDTIDGLQKIAWWDWPESVKAARKNDFTLPADEFVKKYLPEAEMRLRKVLLSPKSANSCSEKTALLIPDFSNAYPLYCKILEQYFAVDRPELRLMIYLSGPESTPENLRTLENIFRKYEERDCDVILQTGETIDEHILFQHADYFITTRSRETVRRTCLADLYQVKLLYGTDEPVFQ